MKPMTDKQYVASGGTVCPICRSSEVSGGSVEVDAGGATQKCECAICGTAFLDCYALVGYLADGVKQKKPVKKWLKVADEKIRHIWWCPGCKAKAIVTPEWYQDNGTPVCVDCDCDMEYLKTEEMK